MKYLATPLVQTGWKGTCLNDARGETIGLMLNGSKRHGSDALAAVQECTALFAAASDMLDALEQIEGYLDGWKRDVVLEAIAQARKVWES